MTTRDIISEINEVFTMPDNLRAGASEITVSQGFFIDKKELDIKSYVLVVGISPRRENGRRRIALYIDGCLYSMQISEYAAEELAQIAAQFAKRNYPLACVRLYMRVDIYTNDVIFEVPEGRRRLYATERVLREVMWLINNGDVEFALKRMTMTEDEYEDEDKNKNKKERKREWFKVEQHDNVITMDVAGKKTITLADGSVISNVRPDRDECDLVYRFGIGDDFIAPGETLTMPDGYTATLAPEIKENSSGKYGLLTEYVPETNGYPEYENTVMYYFSTGFRQQYFRPSKFSTDPSEMDAFSKKILEDAIGKD